MITFVEKTFWTFGLTVERRGQQCSKVHLKFLQFVLLCRSCKSINGFVNFVKTSPRTLKMIVSEQQNTPVTEGFQVPLIKPPVISFISDKAT